MDETTESLIDTINARCTMGGEKSGLIFASTIIMKRASQFFEAGKNDLSTYLRQLSIDIKEESQKSSFNDADKFIAEDRAWVLLSQKIKNIEYTQEEIDHVFEKGTE